MTPLRESFRRSGEWLFRWRSYLPLVPLCLVFGVSFASFRYPAGSHPLDRWWEGFAFAVSLVGLAVRALTVAYVPKGTSGRNTRGQRAEQLNTTGMYSVVRHPLYLGNFLMWLGVVLFPRVGWLIAVVVLVFWLGYERVMFAEEEFLRERYGDSYLQWAGQTPAFLPRPFGWTRPELPFSLRTVLRREYSGLFGLVAVFTGLEVAGDRHALGQWTVDPLWGVVFVCGAVAYAILRLLKRRTRLLDVVGR